MVDTATTVIESERARVVQGYDSEHNPTPLWDFDVMSPIGALKSTPKDMAKFLHSQVASTNSELGKATQLAQRVHRETGDQMMGYGWHINNLRGRRIHWHNGATYGFVSFTGVDLEKRNAVFIVGNQMKIVDGSLDDRIDLAGFLSLLEL